MDDDQYSPGWYNLFNTVVKSCPLLTAFPLIIEIVNRVPDALIGVVFPPGKMFNDFKKLAAQHINEAKKDRAEQAKTNTRKEEYKGTNVFRAIISSNNPEELRTTGRLTKEAQGLFGAATVASARVLDAATFYLLSNAHWRQRLASGLSGPMRNYPTQWPTFSELEQLPFASCRGQQKLKVKSKR